MAASQPIARSDPLVDAYLTRLGLEAEPPSTEALFRLHRAQAALVPYETAWIHLGQAWGIDSAESFRRVATTRRGGYCYHLNGAFAELLAALGYRVSRHVGGVHGADGPSEGSMANHLVLTVSGLPEESNPDGDWFVDVGLGDAMSEPMPLRPGRYRQGPFHLELEPGRPEVADWHLVHDPAGSFRGMAWRSNSVTLDAFEERHRWLSTSPDSGFVKTLTVQRRDAEGADVLRGLVLKRVDEQVSERTLRSVAELFEALEDHFGLDLTDVDTRGRLGLWGRLSRAHDEWEAAGRP